MNCLFCQQECATTYQDHLADQWECYNHNIDNCVQEVSFWNWFSNPDDLHCQIVVLRNNLIYRAYFKKAGDGNNIFTLYVDGAPPGVVLSFDFIPNITPANLANKLSTLLVFS